MGYRTNRAARQAKAALRQFCSGGFVVEVGRAVKDLPIAVHVLAAVVGAAYVHGNLPDLEPQFPWNYTRMVDAVQASVDAEVGAGRVVIVNRHKEPAAEAARIDARLGGKGLVDETLVKLALRVEDGAFATGSVGNLSAKGALCVAAGPSTKQTPQTRLGFERWTKINAGDVAAADVNFFSLMHEVGHCILGATEAEADAFAALMVLRDRSTRDLLPLMAASRELDEWTGSPDDNHWTSASVTAVAKLAAQDGIRDRLRRMSMTEVAKWGKEIAMKAQPKGRDFKLMQAVREALWKINDGEPVMAETAPGKVEKVPYGKWMEASRIPEVRRVRQLRAFLTGERKGLVEPFAFDPAKSMAEMAAARKGGDAGGKMLPGYRRVLESPAPASRRKPARKRADVPELATRDVAALADFDGSHAPASPRMG